MLKRKYIMSKLYIFWYLFFFCGDVENNVLSFIFVELVYRIIVYFKVKLIVLMIDINGIKDRLVVFDVF